MNKQRCPTLGNSVFLGPHIVNGYIIQLRCRNLRQDHMIMSETPRVALARNATRAPPPCPHSSLCIVTTLHLSKTLTSLELEKARDIIIQSPSPR
ncbi:hypothetical protein HKD37_01G002240 [Glycine soja]